MRKKQYVVKLTEDEKTRLQKTVKNGKSPARKITNANILLHLDESKGEVASRSEIAGICHVSESHVYQMSKKYVEQGINSVLERKKRETPPVQPKVTGDIEARIIALSCGEAPEGYSKWTLRLLADKSVELDIIDSISHNTVGHVLKKRIKAASS